MYRYLMNISVRTDGSSFSLFNILVMNRRVFLSSAQLLQNVSRVLYCTVLSLQRCGSDLIFTPRDTAAETVL